MLEDKIINNNFDRVEYGTECLRGGTIEIDPKIKDRYEEATSENIEDVYTRKKLYNDLSNLYRSSKFYEKYGQSMKKLDRKDMIDVYYTFKEALMAKSEYSLVQVVCAIAEFFEMNYKILYNEILSLEDKATVLEGLQELYGLESNFANSKRLF
jgi:hypothetical protein